MTAAELRDADIKEQIQEDLLTLIAGEWDLSDLEERDRFENLACQIVIDNFKKFS